jgi:Carboxypeptidase regulatory-like domain
VASATLTITHRGTGLKRQVQTDESGRFAFPQLHPGPYSMRVQASGLDEQVNESVSAGLGETRTVNFTLRIAAAKQDITVGSEAPLINSEGANTITTITGRAIQDLPNPGGDLTYPAQFAPGALINTAGSSNDFVGGQNGYGNVQFNGLPALSNAYIVDGLETNDPLTNLNSGLSTNLVLGLNSIEEVTVNTTSYAVDQGRYGASQINYVTKSRNGPTPVWTSARKKFNQSRPRRARAEGVLASAPAWCASGRSEETSRALGSFNSQERAILGPSVKVMSR